MNRYRYIQEEAYEGNMKIVEQRLVVFTFGNVSAADRGLGAFAIKPSGVPYGELSPKNMVVVDFEGRVIEGDARPSSDTLTHAVLYKNWENIAAVVHTHSLYATAWAQSQTDIPILGTTHADHLTSDIPCAPPMDDEMIGGNYEQQTGYQILNCFTERRLDYREVEMILLGNHAPFTWGKTVEKAVYNSALLEYVAKLASITLSINPSAPRLKDALIQKHYQRKHGKNSYYGQP